MAGAGHAAMATIGSWRHTVEACTQRKSFAYWMMVWPRTGAGRTGAGGRLGPVLAEAAVLLAQAGRGAPRA